MSDGGDLVEAAVADNGDAHTAGSRSVAGSSLNSLATKVAVYLLGAPPAILLARILGAKGRGEYYLLITYVTILVLLGGMGTVQAQLRIWNTPSLDRRDFIDAWGILSVSLSLIFSAIAVGGFWAFRGSLFRQTAYLDLWAVLPSLTFQLAGQLGGSYLTIDGNLPRLNRAILVSSVLDVGLLTALMVSPWLSVASVLAVMSTSYLVLAAFVWTDIGLPRLTRRGISVAFRLVRVGIAIQPYLIFAFLNLRIDTLILAQLKSVRDVGIYSVSVLMAELVWMISDALTFGVLSRQANVSQSEIFEITLRTIRMNVLLASFGGVALAVSAPALIPVVFGADYRSSVGPMLILLPAAVFMAVWKPIAAPMIRLGGAVRQSMYAMAAAAVNVVANLLLVPLLGVNGASLASAISYALGALLMARWLLAYAGASPRALLPGMRDALRAWTFCTTTWMETVQVLRRRLIANRN